MFLSEQETQRFPGVIKIALYNSRHFLASLLARKTSGPPPNAKQEAIETIERLPDDVPLDEIVYRLFVLNKIHLGLRDIDTGRVIPSETLAAEIEQW